MRYRTSEMQSFDDVVIEIYNVEIQSIDIRSVEIRALNTEHYSTLKGVGLL
ncbi:MAG: hypothetical protein GX279_01715 [Clostridiaceae bacterium]|nr:hypothetical protein [Clostridiaceae bacterium]